MNRDFMMMLGNMFGPLSGANYCVGLNLCRSVKRNSRCIMALLEPSSPLIVRVTILPEL